MGNEERAGRGAHMLVGKGTRVTPTLIIIIIIKLKTDETILFTNKQYKNNTENNTNNINNRKTIQTINMSQNNKNPFLLFMGNFFIFLYC